MSRACLAGLAAVLLLGGCAGSRPAAPPAPTVVRGTVATSTGEALSTGTLVTVRLLDVSRADAPAVPLAEQRLTVAATTEPLRFALAVDPTRLDERRRYVLRAEVRDAAGVLLWTTDRAVPGVLPGMLRDDVAVRVVRVAPPEPPPPPPPPPPPRPARTLAFDCEDRDDAAFRFTLWVRDDEATVWLPPRFGGGSVLVDQVRTASGARYEGDGVAVWTQGAEARLEVRSATFSGCRSAS